MIERNQAADHRLLPNCQPDAVAILQRETSLFVRKTEFFSSRPHRSDFCSSAAGTYQFDGCIKVFSTALVGIHHCMRPETDCETSVVASAVAHVRMQDVVINRIAWA